MAAMSIGCEGVRSVVREAMGVEYEGFTWEDRYLATSTSYDLTKIGFTGAGYIADPEAWAAVFHVPDTGPPGIWRIVYPIGPEVDEKKEMRAGQTCNGGCSTSCKAPTRHRPAANFRCITIRSIASISGSRPALQRAG